MKGNHVSRTNHTKPGNRRTQPFRRPARLTKEALVKLRDTGMTYGSLEKLVEKARGKHALLAKQKTEVALKVLCIAERVFQWRLLEDNESEREEHIIDLARALQELGRPFLPILVFPIAQEFYVIDGHHRLAAYQTAKWKHEIPVEVFQGTLHEARLEALKRNSKNKLRMTKSDKTEAAWRLVTTTELSIRETSILTTVSPRQVSYMRAVWKRRSADLEWKESIEGLLWRQVLRMEGLTKPTMEHEDWIETEAQKMVDALLKAKIGQGLMKNPDITARALAKINADLPKALIYEWGFEAPDAIREIADKLERGPMEF